MARCFSITRAAAVAILVLVPALAAAPEPDRDFSGVWILDETHSDAHALPGAPAGFLQVTEQENVIRCTETDHQGNAGNTWLYRTDGKATDFQIGNARLSSMTKWEGAALLTNTIVSGPQNYNVNDRWQLSHDHNVLTIRRQIQRPSGGESEGVLVYRNRDARAIAAKAPDAPAPGPAAGQARPADEIVVPEGTKIPLSLINSLNTKVAAPGDRVYLETAFPIAIGGRIVIPKGSYVAGTVTEVKRPGKVKGKGEIYVRFDSLTLPNGVTRSFRSRLDSSDTGEFDREEGKIRGEGDKSGDARRVAETTAAGAGVGTIAGSAAGHAGMGAGIGAAAGAAAGIASVLLSRGPDLILPRGTSFEMVLDRNLHYRPSELER